LKGCSMPVKILLADKSITIQKVVEMLFSGKEYEVSCVSDGESAMADAVRIVPDVVLADVDLPRLDGYSFAGRLRETPALSRVPVILMLSRDDMYDAMKGKLAGIVDNIAKPFESQDLIGKVKKALSAAPAPVAERLAAPPGPKPAVAPPPPPRPAAAPPQPVVPFPPPQKPREVVPKDIFDIIQEAPAKAEVKGAPAPSRPAPEKIAMQAEPEESMFEVEPEYEVEPEFEPEQPAPLQMSKSATVSAAPAPVRNDDWAAMAAEAEAARAAAAAVQSAPRAAEPPSAEPEGFDTEQIFGKESLPAKEAPAPVFEPALEAEMPSPEPAAPPSFDFSEPLPAEAEGALPIGQRAMEEMREGLGLGEEAANEASRHPDIVSFESLDMASRASHEDYSFSPPDVGFGELVAEPTPASPAPPAAGRTATAPSRAPEIPEEMLRGVDREAMEKVMREVLERVAWEIIPDLAERLIREEIERLKAEK
jgi:CheY-like chemotaxis protein